MRKKILIFIVTYNASFRVQNIMKKIKKLNLNKDIYKILISDDCSSDNTIHYIKKFKKLKNIKIILNKKNLGYGGNIKKCLFYALKKKFDYAIMIHGDDQYDSKYIPQLTKKLKDKKVDIVTGSRMLNKKDAIRGGMPIYKFFGNIVLTLIFNIISKTNFTDAHTGLWGYNLKIFKKINLNLINNGYNFDNLLRIQAVKKMLNVAEIPIKTFYRTEASSYHLLYSIDFLKNLIISIFKK